MILTSEKDIAISTTLKIVTLMKRTPEKLHKQNRQMRLCLKVFLNFLDCYSSGSCIQYSTAPFKELFRDGTYALRHQGHSKVPGYLINNQ